MSSNRIDLVLDVFLMTGICLIRENTYRMLIASKHFCRTWRDVKEEEPLKHFLCKYSTLLNKRNTRLGWINGDQ